MYLVDDCDIIDLSKGDSSMTQVTFRSLLSKDGVITNITVSTKTATFHDQLITSLDDKYQGNDIYYVALRDILEYCVEREYTNLMLAFPINRVRDIITCKFGYSSLTDLEKEEFKVIHKLIDRLRAIAHKKNERIYVDWMKWIG